MWFGVNTLLWTGAFNSSNLDLLPVMREKGADGVEIARFAFDDFPVAPIRHACEREGLRIVFLSALTGGMSLISPDADVRRRSLAFIRQGIEKAAELGSDTFVGPFYNSVGLMTGQRRTEDEWKRAVEGFQDLTPALDQCGITLAIEPLNRFETYFLNTTADAVRLCEEIGHPRIGILFDTFHANIEEKNVAAALRSCGTHLKHLHTCESDRGRPGTGHIDWPGVFAALGDLKYEHWAVIEGFGSRIPELTAAACIWRDLAPSSEDIAYEGLRHLRSLHAGPAPEAAPR